MSNHPQTPGQRFNLAAPSKWRGNTRRPLALAALRTRSCVGIIVSWDDDSPAPLGRLRPAAPMIRCPDAPAAVRGCLRPQLEGIA